MDYTIGQATGAQVDKEFETVALSIMDRFSHLGETTVHELGGPGSYVVRHSLLPPIGFVLSRSPESGLPTRVDVRTLIAVEFPVTDELLAWLVEAQSLDTTVWIRYRLGMSMSSKGDVRSLDLCFSAFIPEVGSATWSASLGQLMQHTIQLRAEFTDRFGGIVV